MENLNAVIVKKALECCSNWHSIKDCEKCPLNNNGCVPNALEGYALALITSQEQRIGAQDMTISELRQRAEKAEHDADRYAQKIKELTEENERLRAEKEVLETDVKDLKGRNNGLQRANESLAKDCDILEDELNECVQIKADTVRKMQELIYERLDISVEGYSSEEIKSDVRDMVYQIAKEMLEREVCGNTK